MEKYKVLSELKRIRNHFGENDASTFNHWAYAYLDELMKTILNEGNQKLRFAQFCMDYVRPANISGLEYWCNYPYLIVSGHPNEGKDSTIKSGPIEFIFEQWEQMVDRFGTHKNPIQHAREKLKESVDAIKTPQHNFGILGAAPGSGVGEIPTHGLGGSTNIQTTWIDCEPSKNEKTFMDHAKDWKFDLPVFDAPPLGKPKPCTAPWFKCFLCSSKSCAIAKQGLDLSDREFNDIVSDKSK